MLAMKQFTFLGICQVLFYKGNISYWQFAGHAQLPTIHRIPVIGHHRAESSSDQNSQSGSLGRSHSLKGPATPRRAPIRAPSLAPSPGQADPLAEETVVDLTTPRVTSPVSSK